MDMKILQKHFWDKHPSECGSSVLKIFSVKKEFKDRLKKVAWENNAYSIQDKAYIILGKPHGKDLQEAGFLSDVNESFVAAVANYTANLIDDNRQWGYKN